MADVTILHNKNCSTSRHAMDEVRAAGVDAEVVEYLKTPLDRAALEELIGKLEDPVADLVRKDPFFKGLGLDADDYTTPDAVIGLLLEHPPAPAAPDPGEGRQGHHRPPQGPGAGVPVGLTGLTAGVSPRPSCWSTPRRPTRRRRRGHRPG